MIELKIPEIYWDEEKGVRLLVEYFTRRRRLTSSAYVTVPLIVFRRDLRIVLALRLDEMTSTVALTSVGVLPEVQVCRLQPPRGWSVAGAATA
ncbi:hypothetical protein ACGFY3_47555 [Streptomyces mirabilis]|uniref:hypothetical protein n=1 Tax=Streptomyces mirabilis TaxID=68239 RepID=UPI0037200FAA